MQPECHLDTTSVQILICQPSLEGEGSKFPIVTKPLPNLCFVSISQDLETPSISSSRLGFKTQMSTEEWARCKLWTTGELGHVRKEVAKIQLRETA